MADRLIRADALRERMYHDAFETDSDMQKWDSGCWIRYKMFENALDDALAVDAVEVVRCKDCKHRIPNPHGYTCKRLFKEVNLDHYCSWGERREDETN